jgi:hypothetical protein
MCKQKKDTPRLFLGEIEKVFLVKIKKIIYYVWAETGVHRGVRSFQTC